MTGLDLVFLGPPGAGKGTQAAELARRRGVPHVSTGDLLRGAVKADSPLGRQARGYLDRGRLVPDEVVVGMVRERLDRSDARKGFILDGFPRTVAQAEALDRELTSRGRRLRAVVLFELQDDEVLERLGGRLTCTSCGAMYHLRHEPPSQEGICDRCGGGLEVREDDRPGTVRRRLEEYREKTAPLVAYYQGRGILRRVDASGPIEEVRAALEGLLGGE